MGFVAVERLALLAGELAVFDFWRQLNEADFETAFETAFGIPLAEFYATFDDYLNGDPPAIRPAPTNRAPTLWSEVRSPDWTTVSVWNPTAQ